MHSNVETPLRILQVSTRDISGGAEGSAWNLFNAYRQRGFGSWLAVGSKVSNDNDVLVVQNERYRPAWTRMCRRFQALGAGSPLAPLTQLLGKLAWLGEPRRLAERYLGIEDFHYPGSVRLLGLPPRRPTIVHCHNLHGNYFDLRALPWLSRQVPVVVNLRDAWLLSGHCAHSLGCDRWKTECGNCPSLSTYPSITRDATAYNWRRKRDIYARSHLYVTTTSRWLMDQVNASMLKGIKYRVIPNAINLNVFCPGDRMAARNSLNLPLNARIVLLIAHNMFKDLATMEAALALIRTPVKAEDLIFVCLGRNGEDRPLGQGYIRYLGIERDPRRMALFYQASDLYIHAAKAEAFGKAIIEAMACGTPVVATAVGGIPEQIDDDKTGFLADHSDAKHMGELVQRLLGDDELRERVSQAAISYARQQFDLSRQVDAFLDWYADVQEDWLCWKSNA